MKSFADFWALLEKDNPIWYDFTKMRYFSKDIKKCAQDAYAYLISDLDTFNKMDGNAIRKYMTSWLMKAPDAPQAPQLQQVDNAPKIENVPLTPEQIARRKVEYDKWIKSINEAPMSQPIPKLTHKEVAENGGWVPKKDPGIVITEEQKQKSLLEHMNTVKTAKRKEFLHYNPDATEEQIIEYIESFKFEF